MGEMSVSHGINITGNATLSECGSAHNPMYTNKEHSSLLMPILPNCDCNVRNSAWDRRRVIEFCKQM